MANARRRAPCRMAARCGRPLAVAMPDAASKGGAAAHPAAHACVVGQRRHWRHPRRLAAPHRGASARNGHSTALSAGCAVAEHHGLRRSPASPRSAVSTHSGDTLRPKAVISTFFLRPLHVQEAIRVDRAEIAGRPPLRRGLAHRPDSRRTGCRAISISPSARYAIRACGSARPALPGRSAPGRLSVCTDAPSDRP